MVLKSVIHGIDLAARNWRMTLVIYAFNLAATSVVVLALHAAFFAAFGKRALSLRMLDGFDFTLLTDLNYQPFSFTPYIGVAVTVAVAYLLYAVFVSGGVLGTLYRSYIEHEEYQASFSLSKFFADEFSLFVFFSERFSLQYFFSDAGRYAKRFFKLFALFLTSLLLPFGVLFFWIAVGTAAAEDAPSEVPLMLSIYTGIAGALVMLTYTQLAFDLARLKVVTENERSVRKALGWGAGLMWRRFPTVTGLFLMYNAFLAIVIFLYFKVEFVLEPRAWHQILLTFVFQQLFILGRVVLRHALLASQLCFVEALPASGALRGVSRVQNESDERSGKELVKLPTRQMKSTSASSIPPTQPTSSEPLSDAVPPSKTGEASIDDFRSFP